MRRPCMRLSNQDTWLVLLSMCWKWNHRFQDLGCLIAKIFLSPRIRVEIPRNPSC